MNGGKGVMTSELIQRQIIFARQHALLLSKVAKDARNRTDLLICGELLGHLQRIEELNEELNTQLSKVNEELVGKSA